MTDNQDIIKRGTNYLRRSVTIKIISIGFLILLLLIPAAMIQGLIRERQIRRDSAVEEINQKWGNVQTITGPFITVPYRSFYTDLRGETQFNLKYLHVLPENLSITGSIAPKILKRSLFEAVVFNADLQFKGNFRIPAASRINIDANNILWDKAHISLGITDMRGIKEKIVVVFNGTEYKSEPGLKTSDIAAAGVSTTGELPLPGEKGNFSFGLNIRGSDQLSFIPIGETNSVEIKSGWPSPSFNGAFLPDNREVNEDGFSAKWKILHLNRNYPQFWEGAQYNVEDSSFGVELILTADIYQKSMRLAKYAVMFLVFTFAAFFLSETINKQRVHPVQYILTGTAVLIFYTLVLSLSEHMDFNFAYIIAATSVTLIVSAYARTIFSGSRFALTILGMLAALYSYFFIILQLEDYALLMGSIGLMIIIAAVMYVTRGINWYEIEADQKENGV